MQYPMSRFDDIPKNRIFEDYSVLKCSEIPNEEPVNQQTVRTALQSMVDLLGKGKVPPTLFLFGPPGSGKTYLTHHCFEREQPSNTTTEISTVWVNKMNQTRRGNALSVLCRQFDDQLPALTDAPEPHSNSSELMVQEQIRERLETHSTPVVVIFDEFTLTKPIQSIIRYVLYPLRNEMAEIPLGLVFLSYKTQYEELADCFDSGGPIHLELGHYSQEEMTRILSRRAADAFQPGAVRESILELCAKIAVERNATPRGAQELLLRAGAEAAHLGESTISERHIQKGVAEMESTTWS